MAHENIYGAKQELPNTIMQNKSHIKWIVIQIYTVFSENIGTARPILCLLHTEDIWV